MLKKCFFCAEEIKKDAIKCKYCHEFLTGDVTNVRVGVKIKLLTVEEVAYYIGASTSTIRKWIRTGKIPAVKINGSIKFDINVIDKWIQKGKIKTIDDFNLR